MDGLDELVDAAEAGVVQRPALEDAEPDLDLVEPAGAGGRASPRSSCVCSSCSG